MLLRTWIGRLLILIVIAWNIQAAIFLLINSSVIATSIEIPQIAGPSLIRGIGVLFIMWNIPYLFAAAHPVRFRISLVESLLMQFIALAGELILLSVSPIIPPALQNIFTIYSRFDAAGMALLLAAAAITWRLPAARRLGRPGQAEAR
jgi:hypothetical protein